VFGFLVDFEAEFGGISWMKRLSKEDLRVLWFEF
jgi:hypothetical protein